MERREAVMLRTFLYTLLGAWLYYCRQTSIWGEYECTK
jgi:hypothetical protein